MAEAEPRQRKNSPQNSGKGSEQQHEAEEEEQSIIKGLLPCILGIGGVAIGIWLFIYMFIYVPPQNDNGLVQCTRVQSVEELLVGGLEDVTMWKELGQQLKISQTHLSHIQKNSVATKEKTNEVLRAWFEGNMHRESCWEEVTQALQNIGMQTLAEQLAQKNYGQ